MESIIRLSSLKISNIKNVRTGQIVMPNACRKKLAYQNAEILGLYGQNGSGKTAIIDTLYYLQKIMTGSTLEDEIADYIDTNSTEATISADFNIFTETLIYEVNYNIILQKCQNSAQIVCETLSCAVNKGDSRTNKTVFMHYQRSDKENIFTPKKRLEEIAEADTENKMDLIVAKKIAEKSNCSYIFGESSREIFFRNYENNFKQYTHSGVISANFLLPMAFKIKQNEIGMKGDFAVPLSQPVVLNEERKRILETIVEQVNMVLFTIIPGMKIEVYNHGMQLSGRARFHPREYAAYSNPNGIRRYYKNYIYFKCLDSSVWELFYLSCDR